MMKNLFVSLLFVLLASPVAMATDMTLTFSDSIIPGDSADERFDTTNSVKYDIRDWVNMYFYSYLRPYENKDDTNLADDSFYLYLQFSPDGYTWGPGDTFCLDTLLDSDSGWSWLSLNRDTINCGNYMRVMLYHVDSIAVSEADSTLVNRDAPFWKQLYVWITGTKR